MANDTRPGGSSDGAATIIRVAERRRFTVIDNTPIEDDRLSYRALGLLVYLLSKPDNWRANVAHLSARHKEGREAVRTALHELEDAGYVVRRWSKGQQTPTREYFVYENPQVTTVAQEPAGRETGRPEIAPVVKTEVSKDGENPPAQQAARGRNAYSGDFAAWWRLYPRKIGKGQAWTAWRSALQRTTVERLMAGVVVYATKVAGVEMDKVAHPATWLNGDRWLDDANAIAPARPNGRNPARVASVDIDRGGPSGRMFDLIGDDSPDWGPAGRLDMSLNGTEDG